MVSGIGPKEILTQQNIPVIVDRQVGQNWQVSLVNAHTKRTPLTVQDHCAFEFQYAMNVEGNAALEGNEQFLEEATQDFIDTQTGPLTNWGGDILGRSIFSLVITSVG